MSLPAGAHVHMCGFAQVAWTGGSAVASCASVPPRSQGSGSQPGTALALQGKLSLDPQCQEHGLAAPPPPHRRRPGPGLRRGHAAPSSCRLLPSAAGPAGFPAADSAQAPHAPHTPPGAAGRGVRPADAAPQLRGFSHRFPDMAGVFLPASHGDPPAPPAPVAQPWCFCRSYRNTPLGRQLWVGWV